MKTTGRITCIGLSFFVLWGLNACRPIGTPATVTLIAPTQEAPAPTVAPSAQPVQAMPARLTGQEAVDLIKSYLLQQKPNLDPNFDLAVEELTTREDWDRLPAQVFRLTNGIFPNESFLSYDGVVLPLGTAFGGQGVTSMLISDLDRDGQPELLFSYSFGSGIHQSRLGMYVPAYDEKRTYEANLSYLGDLEISPSHNSSGDVNSTGEVSVLAVDDPQDPLMIGNLAIEQNNGQVDLVLRTAQGLPQDILDKIKRVNTPDEAAYWVEKQDPHYGVRFAVPCFWDVDFPDQYPAGGIAYSIRNYPYDYALTIGKNTDEIWQNGGIKIDMNFTTGETWKVPPGSSLIDFVNQLYGDNPEVRLVSTEEERVNDQPTLLVTTESTFGPGQFYLFSVDPHTYLMFSPSPGGIQNPDVQAISNSITINPQGKFALPDQAPGQPPVGIETTCPAR